MHVTQRVTVANEMTVCFPQLRHHIDWNLGNFLDSKEFEKIGGIEIF